MQSIKGGENRLFQSGLLPVQQLGAADASIYAIRGDVYKYILIPAEKAKTLQDILLNQKIVNDNIAQYKAIAQSAEEKTYLADFDKKSISIQKMRWVTWRDHSTI